MLGGDFDGNPTRKNIFALISGALFAIGWFLVFDVVAITDDHADYRTMKFVYVLPSIFCFLCMVIFNGYSWEDFKGEGFSEFNATRARAFFMIGLVGMFLCLGFGIWVAVDKFIDVDYVSSYGGIAIIVNLILTVISAIVLRIGTAS